MGHHRGPRVNRLNATLTWRRLFSVDLPHPKGLAHVSKQTAVDTTLLHPRRSRLRILTLTGLERATCGLGLATSGLGFATYGLGLDDFRIRGLKLGVRGLGLATMGLDYTSGGQSQRCQQYH